MISLMDPTKLAGLKQATYVMQCLIKGQSKEDIAASLANDEQLVRMWILFLKHNQWIEETMNGWSMTAKGRTWCGKGVDSTEN